MADTTDTTDYKALVDSLQQQIKDMTAQATQLQDTDPNKLAIFLEIAKIFPEVQAAQIKLTEQNGGVPKIPVFPPPRGN